MPRHPRIGVGVTTNHASVPFSRIGEMTDAGFATYLIRVDQAMNEATIVSNLSEFLDHDVYPVILVGSTAPVPMASIQEMLGYVDFDPRVKTFTVGNEIQPNDLVAYLSYYEEAYSEIHGWGIADTKVSPPGIADGMLTSGEGGNAANDSAVDLHVAASGEFLNIHHHSIPSQLRKNIQYLRAKDATKELQLLEAAFPDPLAFNVTNDEDAINSLIEEGYVTFFLDVIRNPDIHSWAHGTFVHNGTGNRFDWTGLWTRSDETTLAYDKFVEVLDLAQNPRRPQSTDDRPVVSRRRRGVR